MKNRIYLALAICALGILTLSAVAQTQRKEGAILVINTPVEAKLQAGNTSTAIKGHISLYLEASSDQLKNGVVYARQFNLVFFNVPQAVISGKETAVKYGVLGMAIPAAERPKVKYDAHSQTLAGEITVRAHFPQIDEIFPPEPVKDDKEADDYISRTQRGTVKFQIRLTGPLEKAAAEAARSAKIGEIAAHISASVEVELLKDSGYTISPYRIQLLEARPRVQVASWTRFEAARTLCIQPVRIGGSSRDLAPTGAGLAFGMPGANLQWNKADIVFQVRSWMTVFNAGWKVSSSDAEEDSIRASVNVDDCIEVFFVENFSPVNAHGGGVTQGSGTAVAKIITSDGNVEVEGGINLTHLAHELGHVLNLCHPDVLSCLSDPARANSSTNTLMCGSGWLHDNPKQNSQDNADRVSNPLLIATIKLVSEGPDCTSSADCGACLGIR